MEVYADDMVIKSKGDSNFLRDIEERMVLLKETNMKLNCKKCIFVVQKGKFLRHIVTTRGIEANSDKVEALISIPTLRLSRRSNV